MRILAGLLFLLRHADPQELVRQAGSAPIPQTSKHRQLEGADLCALFGIEYDKTPAAAAAPQAVSPAVRTGCQDKARFAPEGGENRQRRRAGRTRHRAPYGVKLVRLGRAGALRAARHLFRDETDQCAHQRLSAAAHRLRHAKIETRRPIPAPDAALTAASMARCKMLAYSALHLR